MKTILYQPLFINPQAYFVFPQLYHIEISIVSTDGNLITTAAYSVYINDGNIIDVPIISEEVFNKFYIWKRIYI